ncbi:MAG: peptide-methionine (S)-S-oxide reductase [Flammeovirgaceae bacterium]|nr:peptide-methionine (S)-S-oxide reductase [Flammeovirgaceae bacterium]HCX24014.1 peptide-methionine (S)-S-oxide reductase [Cytophagales bacterium]|tara:strand:+ start:1266 stop:1910 length:645 start_codon:yes stop_codon:yes gene_type:complete
MKMTFYTIALSILISCSNPTSTETKNSTDDKNPISYQKLDTATFAGGCFWCVEASFEQIEGVFEAVSGYAGGKESTANYKMVSYGRTEHAETVQVYYDPDVISYETLLDIFFTAHDPTQLNRQGPDVGTQYRSAIFYHNEDQLKLAEAKIDELSDVYPKPIVTQLNAYTAFYPAEDYHQDYEENHPYDRYIMNVSRPKIERVKNKFKDILKQED